LTSARLRSLVGVVLLVSNSPFGWGCVAAAGWLASQTGEPRWLAFGAVGYGVSWAMLGLAVVLLGREGVKAVRARLRWRRSTVPQVAEEPVAL
jgi:hypothetical protein